MWINYSGERRAEKLQEKKVLKNLIDDQTNELKDSKTIQHCNIVKKLLSQLETDQLYDTT